MAWFCEASRWFSFLRSDHNVLSAQLDEHSAALARVKSDLRAIKFMLTRPGALAIRMVGERMPNMILFAVDLQPPLAADTVSRELTVQVGFNAPVVSLLPGNALVVEDLEGPQGETVGLALVDVDDAGNRSPERTLSAVLADTMAPPQPGEMGVRMTGERFDPDPEPEPPTPEPEPEPPAPIE